MLKDTKGVIIRRIWKDRKYNWIKERGHKDKQWWTEHYTENTGNR